jgi:hypothetical protein
MPAQKSDKPQARLTRIADAMRKALENHPEFRGDEKVMIFLDDEEMGGMFIGGYEAESEAIVDLFVHLAAIFEANGQKLMVIPVGRG